MSTIASAITNPGQLISFPMVIFESAIKFGMAMMTQSSEFVLGLFRLFV
jgi:hypothetical protein